jgi:hypothetical protein
MKSDLRHRVMKNTPLSASRPLLPVLEAIVNSLQSLEESSCARPEIRIRIVRQAELALGNDAGRLAPITAFEIEDNGRGFDDANIESFITYDSSYKAPRGGKGVGRLLWLKAFDFAEIESVYTADGQRYLRSFRFSFTDDPEGVIPELASDRKVGTRVRLVNFRDPYREHAPRSHEILADRIIEHCLAFFLRPRCPTINLDDGAFSISLNAKFNEQYGTARWAREITVQEQTFTLSVLKAPGRPATGHSLTYAADSREVLTESLSKILPWGNTKLSDENGQPFACIAFIEGQYLDDHVNSERTAFIFPTEHDDQRSTIAGELTLFDIRKACGDVIAQSIAPDIARFKDEHLTRVEEYINSDAPQYRPLLRNRDELFDRVPPGLKLDDLDVALYRVIHEKAAEARKDMRAILNQELDPNHPDEYRKKFHEMVQKLETPAEHALAQYVVHRRVMLDLFEKALQRDVAGNYPLEEVVHEIVFPMRTTSNEIDFDRQNLWLVDERLTSHSFLASDRSLKSIDVANIESRKRADLIIFGNPLAYSEGESPLASLVIVEFKRPQRDGYGNDSPIGQVYNLLRDIRSGTYEDHRGRTVPIGGNAFPAYCYVICDITRDLAKLAEDAGFKRTPDQMGMYTYNEPLSAYVEILSYDKVVSDAKKRNRALFNRLNI